MNTYYDDDAHRKARTKRRIDQKRSKKHAKDSKPQKLRNGVKPPREKIKPSDLYE